MQDLMIMLTQKYPLLISVLSIMGIMRAINKPLFALIRSYVQATDNKSDDALLDKVEQSKVYSYICFALDWFASVKMGPQAPK